MEEGFGERNHQVETRADMRYAGTRDFAQKEKYKAKDQAQRNHPSVQVKVEKYKQKRKYCNAQEDGVQRISEIQQQAQLKRQKRIERRSQVLQLVVPETQLLSLKGERERLFLLDSTTIDNDDNDN